MAELEELRAENRALRTTLERERRERDELYVLALRYLGVAIDAKDAYTRGHAERVTLYSRAVARALEGRDHEALVGQVTLAGQLHDVGKVWVPDAVLRKPGGLSTDEWYEMKQHPVLGEYLISSSLLLRDARAGVRGHHERVDGRGYPDGLKGDAIPELSRILSVCDAFDAMTLQRVYRPTVLTDAKALEELRRCSGTQFDPEVVETLARTMAAGEILLARGQYYESEKEPGAWEQAAACYRRALESADRSDPDRPARIGLTLGRLLARQRREEAIACLERALGSAGAPALRAEAATELALAHYNRGNLDQALRCSEQAQGPALSAHLASRAAHLRALVHARRKERPAALARLEAAERGFREGLAELEAAGPGRDAWQLMHRFERAREQELRIAEILDSRATVLLDLGDCDGAARSAQASLDLKSRHGDFYGSSISLSTAGLISMWKGELEQARSSFQRALRLAEMVGDLGGQNVVRNRLGELLVRSGDADRAIEHLHLGLSLAERQGRELAKCYSCVGLARAFLAKGDLERSRHYAEQALAVESGARIEVGALAHLARAEARARLGDAAGARGDFARAEEILRPLDVPWEELELAQRHAEFLRAQGDAAAAGERERRAGELVRRLGAASPGEPRS
jgi:tetratricopeptide (TPR) repeat protein